MMCCITTTVGFIMNIRSVVRVSFVTMTEKGMWVGWVMDTPMDRMHRMCTVGRHQLL
jgi:hypothetical protein